MFVYICVHSNSNDEDCKPDSTETSDNAEHLDELVVNASDIPDCWSYAQLTYFKTENSWLSVKNKMLKCTVCGDAKHLGCTKKQGMKLAEEWVNGTLSSYGDTKNKQQLLLRKKIVLNRDSGGHKCADSILNDTSKSILAHTIAKQHSGQFLTTNRVLRTVYKQVKLILPFLNFETEIDLQMLNGLECDLRQNCGARWRTNAQASLCRIAESANH